MNTITTGPFASYHRTNPAITIDNVERIKLLRSLTHASEKRLKKLKRCILSSDDSIFCEKAFLFTLRCELERQEKELLFREFGVG